MRSHLFSSFGLGLAVTGASIAQAPSDLSDLIGARAAGAETQMITRGFVNVGGTTGDDRSWTYWWNGRTRTCVTVATVNGRYDSVTRSPAPDCQRQGGAETLPARPWRPGTGQPQQTAEWFDTGLICFGEGRRPALASRYGYAWDPNRGRYTYGNRTKLSSQDFDESVTVQLWSDGGRIRLPAKLIPPIHSRGDHGWWELSNVSIGRDRIIGEYRLNGLNKPRLTVDRRSGRISIRGASGYGFAGTCDTVDNAGRRF